MGGSYSATPLAAPNAWSESGNSGSFDYTYPVSLPPAPAGDAAPDLSMYYSSQAVDGLSAGANSQGSWAGMGWNLEPGYIERELVSCASVNYGRNYTYEDECYPQNPTYTYVSGGSSTPLIQDTQGPNPTNTWYLQSNPGWKVEQTSGWSNGAKLGEGWKLTNPDGLQYFFGYGTQKSGAGAATQSVYTVPVYAKTSSQPCWDPSTPVSSFCPNVAWRWNVDRVIDRNGNEASMTYDPETNNYGRAGDNTKVIKYVRAGSLAEVDYGRINSNETPNWPVKVTLVDQPRCSNVKTDGTCPATPTLPDVPTDLSCADGASSCSHNSPSYYTRQELHSISTSVLSGDGTTYNPVSTYAFSYVFPASGDGTDPVLFLDKVVKTGSYGSGSTPLPNINFNPVQKDNRADAVPANMPRIDIVRNETGGSINVNYGRPNPCSQADLTHYTAGHWDHNAESCFPALAWEPDAPAGQQIGFGAFNKWMTTDATLSSPAEPNVHTNYVYLGNPHWHHDEDPAIPCNTTTCVTTWNEWRGYPRVQVTVGNTAGSTEVTNDYYYQGMDGDPNDDGSTKTGQTVNDADGNAHADTNSLAGQLLDEQVVGFDGTELTDTLYDFWTNRKANGIGWNADIVRPDSQRTREHVTGQPARVRTVTTNYNGDGLVQHTDDTGGPGASEVCSDTSYQRNNTKWIIDTPAQVMVSDCGSTFYRNTEYYYDAQSSSPYSNGQPAALAPTQGNVSDVIVLNHPTNAYAPSVGDEWTHTEFDAYGRATLTQTALDHAASTSTNVYGATSVYSPSTGFPNTITTTNQTLKTTTTINAAFGLPISIIDNKNSATTTLDYDNLGRLVDTYLPDNPSSSGIPDQKFNYQVSTGGYSSVKSSQLIKSAGTYSDTYNYYDGFGNIRQTQTASDPNYPLSPTAKRLIAWTLYNDRGQVQAVTAPTWRTGTVADGKADYPTDTSSIASEHDYLYDALGRQTKDTLVGSGTPKWSTSTAYYGDHDTVTDPDGNHTDNYTDMRGDLTQVVQDISAADPTFHAVYSYDRLGELTNAQTGGHQLTGYTYDMLGRTTQVNDADAGTTNTTYDADNNVTSVNTGGSDDGLGTCYTFDHLDRRTGLYDTTSAITFTNPCSAASGTLAAKWTYDGTESNGIGRLASATRKTSTGDWTTTYTGYDGRGQVLGESRTIPTSLLSTGNTFATSYTYSPSGEQTKMTYPLDPGGRLFAEDVTTGYDSLGSPLSLTGVGGAIVSGTTYTPLRQILTRTSPVTSGNLIRSYDWQTATLRLNTIKTALSTATVPFDWSDYGYDPDGNVTGINEPIATQKECFSYDKASRLTHAFTTSSSAATPADCDAQGPNGGGTAPAYNLSYDYTDAGSITDVINHIGTSVTNNYHYTDTQHLHAPTSVQPDNGLPSTINSYGDYGELIIRTTGPTTSTYSWDQEHHLTGVNSSGIATPTTFVYDGDGNRIARTEADGVNTKTTVYLPNEDLTVKNNAVVKATRYYMFGGATVAVRSNDGTTMSMKYLSTNAQSSETASVDFNGTLNLTRYLPYGAHRDTGFTGFGTDHGFLGNTEDATGLDDLTNRYYDPVLATFTKPDPLGDLADPQSLNGYNYANDNPETYSDPSGLCAQLQAECATHPPAGATNGGGGGGSGGSGGGGGSTSGPVPSPAPGPPPYVPFGPSAGCGTFFLCIEFSIAVGVYDNGAGLVNQLKDSDFGPTSGAGRLFPDVPTYTAPSRSGQEIGFLAPMLIGGLRGLGEAADAVLARLTGRTVEELAPVLDEVAGSFSSAEGGGGLNLPFQNAGLRSQVGSVVGHMDEYGAPPPGVAQGGLKGYPKGVYGNKNGALPPQPTGYYRESDIWASGNGIKRGGERLVFGAHGDAYYSSDHYDSFVRIR